MMKNYVTFGQGHVHSVNGKTFDKDCVAVYETVDDEKAGRAMAFELFGDKFHRHLVKEPGDEFMSFFPRGFLHV